MVSTWYCDGQISRSATRGHNSLIWTLFFVHNSWFELYTYHRELPPGAISWASDAFWPQKLHCWAPNGQFSILALLNGFQNQSDSSPQKVTIIMTNHIVIHFRSTQTPKSFRARCLNWAKLTQPSKNLSPMNHYVKMNRKKGSFELNRFLPSYYRVWVVRLLFGLTESFMKPILATMRKIHPGAQL